MDTQAMMPPLTPPTTKTMRRSGIVLTVAFGIAIGVLVYFLAPVQEALSVSLMPPELRTAQFLSEREEGLVVYGVSGMGFATQELRREPEVAAVFDAEINTATRKGQWILSPNKISVAFTELITPLKPRLPQSWQVTVADVRTGSQKALGTGFGALFVDEMHVARLSATGIIVTDLASSTEKNVLPLTLERVPDTVSVSPNGGLIAWSVPEEHTIVVYTVSHDAATVVTKYIGLFDSFTLTNKELYLLKYGDHGTQVVRYALAEDAKEEHVVTLPGSLKISGLSFR
jgi:hypothetical protein